jgi:hypothetical protein
MWALTSNPRRKIYFYVDANFCLEDGCTVFPPGLAPGGSAAAGPYLFARNRAKFS